MDDSNFNTVRKNLNIISVLILLLAYSKAEISHLKFLGIDLTLDGEKFYIGLFVIYIYFIWRYLTKLEFRSGFVHEFTQWMLNGNKGIKKEYNLESCYNQVFQGDEGLQEQFENKNFTLTKQSVTRYKNQGKYQYRLSISFQNRHEQGGSGTSQKTKNVELSLSWHYWTRKFIYYSLKHDKFGDYLFPLLICFVNVLFFIFNTEWQGSFNKIFLDN